MPVRDAPEPLDESAAPVAHDRDRGDRPGRAAGDLAAVPAFLRGRPGSSSPAPARVVRAPAPPEPVVDAAALPMAGIAPRRLIVIGLTIVVVWLVVSFGRQVVEASAASSRSDELRSANAALAREVTALERELQTIQDERYIAQAARAYRLGSAKEIPFALEAGAPPLGPDAPGSASVRLGADDAPSSPLESWLRVLFGAGG